MNRSLWNHHFRLELFWVRKRLHKVVSPCVIQGTEVTLGTENIYIESFNRTRTKIIMIFVVKYFNCSCFIKSFEYTLSNMNLGVHKIGNFGKFWKFPWPALTSKLGISGNFGNFHDRPLPQNWEFSNFSRPNFFFEKLTFQKVQVYFRLQNTQR